MDERQLTNQPTPQVPLRKCTVCGVDNSQGKFVHGDNPRTGVGELCSLHFSEHIARLEKERREREGSEILENLPEWTRDQLSRAGLRDEELKATLEDIQDPIPNLLPGDKIDTFLSGKIPRSGFGLCGTSGAGKTMAIAALLREAVMARARQYAKILGQELQITSIKWVCWPSQCGRWRLEGSDPNFKARNRLVQDCSQSRLLVLDDLGREGTTGGRTYMDDPCTRLLDLVVSERDAANLPTLWTSNLDEEGLILTYGAALHRRIERLNPAIYIP